MSYIFVGYGEIFQYMCTVYTDRNRVISISPSLTCLYDWGLGASVFCAIMQ